MREQIHLMRFNQKRIEKIDCRVEKERSFYIGKLRLVINKTNFHITKKSDSLKALNKKLNKAIDSLRSQALNKKEVYHAKTFF